MQGQLRAMRRGLAQTRKAIRQSERLVKASEAQKDTMQGQLDAMKEQAIAMQASLDETRKVVALNEQALRVSKIQAQAAQNAVRAAEESNKAAQEAFYIAERAYLRVQGVESIRLNVGDGPYIRVWLFNGGRTPARDIFGQSQVILGRELVTKGDLDALVIHTAGGDTLLAGDRRICIIHPPDIILTEETLRAIYAKELMLMVIGEFRYKDFWDKEQVYSYRGVYDPADNNFTHY
jgi:hypothetical protein